MIVWIHSGSTLRVSTAFVSLPDFRGGGSVTVSTTTIILPEISLEYFKTTVFVAH
jgi:hypothetical protein